MSDEFWQPIRTLPADVRVILGVWKGEIFHWKIGYRSEYGGFPGWSILVMPEVWHVLPCPPPRSFSQEPLL